MSATINFLKNTISAMALARLRARHFKYYYGKGSNIYSWRIHCAQSNLLYVGANSFIQTRIVFERDEARVVIENETFIGQGTISAAECVEIGNKVLIAWGVTIFDHDSHSLIFSERSEDCVHWLNGKKEWSHVMVKPVSIQDNAWIGYQSIILKGITIGEGAIIGAGSVVTKDVMPWTIVAGNPARLIREIPADER